MQVLQWQQKLFFAFLLNASLEIIALRQTKPLRYLCLMHKNNFLLRARNFENNCTRDSNLTEKKCFLNLAPWAK